MTEPDNVVSLIPREPATAATGATALHVLDRVEDFLARFVAYPSDDARVAHALWIAHTWLMDEWEETPRVFFSSPEAGSGKSRALDVTEPLVPRPVKAVNVTPAYLVRKVSDPAGLPTILYDEIDTVFGGKAREGTEDIRAFLNAGYRKGTSIGRVRTRGNEHVPEDLPAFCAVALAGIDNLPDTISSRCVIVRMRRRAPDQKIDKWRHRDNFPEGLVIGTELAKWASRNRKRVGRPQMPDGVEDRNADVWEPLLAVADLAGGDWPRRARVAAVAHVAAAKGMRETVGIRLLSDLRSVFADVDRLSTTEILDRLHKIEGAPWGDWYGGKITARWLSDNLARYEVSPRTIRIGDRTPKGYLASDLVDSWRRYVDPAIEPGVSQPPAIA